MTYIPTPKSVFYEQGKSNSKIADELAGYLDLGKAAKKLSKKFGLKVLAKHLEKFEDTKHHVPAPKKFGGARLIPMIAPDTFDSITKEQLEQILFEEQKSLKKTVQGFYHVWDSERGRYNRTVKFKVLQVWEGLEGKMPKSIAKTFVELDKKSFEIAKTKVGATYYGWDEPAKADFLPDKEKQKLAKEKAKREAKEAKMREKAQKEHAKLVAKLQKSDKEYANFLEKNFLKTPENYTNFIQYVLDKKGTKKWVAYKNGEAVAFIYMHDADRVPLPNTSEKFGKFREIAKTLLTKYGEVISQ